MKTYILYIIEAFEKYDPITQNYYNVKKVEVIADNETDAMELAKKRVKAQNYEVRSCYERLYDTHSK